MHNLRVTEIMYHPAPGPAELPYMEEDFEYLEIANIGATPIDLAGVRFIDGIQFSFGDTAAPELRPASSPCWCDNRAAFEALYGTGVRVLGEYGGPAGSALDNSGETVTLVDFGGGVIQSFVYNDAMEWPQEPDGVGNSLVIVDRMANPDTWNQPTGWRASFDAGGSPGGDDYLKGDFNSDQNVNFGRSGDPAAQLRPHQRRDPPHRRPGRRHGRHAPRRGGVYGPAGSVVLVVAVARLPLYR